MTFVLLDVRLSNLNKDYWYNLTIYYKNWKVLCHRIQGNRFVYDAWRFPNVSLKPRSARCCFGSLAFVTLFVGVFLLWKTIRAVVVKLSEHDSGITPWNSPRGSTLQCEAGWVAVPVTCTIVRFRFIAHKPEVNLLDVIRLSAYMYSIVLATSTTSSVFTMSVALSRYSVPTHSFAGWAIDTCNGGGIILPEASISLFTNAHSYRTIM